MRTLIKPLALGVPTKQMRDCREPLKVLWAEWRLMIRGAELRVRFRPREPGEGLSPLIDCAGGAHTRSPSWKEQFP
jgi:hypothetical protein